MKKRRIVYIACCTCLGLAGFVLVSCDDSQERIDKTIEAMDASLGKASDAAKGSMLYELRISTPESLKQPRIIKAALVEQDSQASFVFKWIEKHPSPDAYRIISESSQYKGTWKIDDWDHQENRKRYERDLVLFTGGYAWRPDNKEWAGDWDEWQNLKKALVSGGCKIVLLKDGEVVSNTFPVKYIEGSTLKKKTKTVDK